MNPEAAVQGFSINFNRALKSRLNVKVHINYWLFSNKMGRFSALDFRFLTFTKFVEVLKIDTTKAS